MFDTVSGNFTAIDSEGITIDLPDISIDFLKNWKCLLQGNNFCCAGRNWPFTIPSDYFFDSDLIEVISGIARLKDLTLLGSTFYANYENNEDGVYGDGDLNGSLYGGATVSGGKLDLTGYDAGKYIDYSAVGNADSEQQGCLRFKLTPNYTGAPTFEQNFLEIAKYNQESSIQIYHKTNAHLQLYIFGSNSIAIMDLLTAWSPIAGQEYEFELNYDITNGETRLFIDGVQKGATQTGTGVRDNILLMQSGRYFTIIHGKPNFYLDDLLIFNTPQHTANYISGQLIPQSRYSILNPTIFPRTGISINGLTNFIETANKPVNTELKYHTSFDDGVTWKYWDGSAWIVSDNTYIQANTASEINININSLADPDLYRFQAILHSENGDVRPELDNIEIKGQINTRYDITGNTKTRINFENNLAGTGFFRVDFIDRTLLTLFESDFSNINKIPDALITKKRKTTDRFFEEKIKGQFRYLFSDYQSDINPLDRIINLREIQTAYCYYLISSVYQDLSIEEGDQNDYKNRQYMGKYKEIIKDSLALLSVDKDGSEDLDNLEKSKPNNTGGMLSR